MIFRQHKISIILPVENEAISIARTLDSILQQPEADNVVVVDAGARKLASRYIESNFAADIRISVIHGDSHSNLWHLLSLGIGKVQGNNVMIASPGEWFTPGSFAKLIELLDSSEPDCIQMTKVKRIRNIAVRSRYDLSGSVNEKIGGADYLEIVRLRGNDRLITDNITDKVYDRELLVESLKLAFDGKWGTEEILNLHYFRHARSIMFSDVAAINTAWASPVEVYGFTDLKDMKKTFEIKFLTTSDKKGVGKELHDSLISYIQKFISQLGWTREALEFYMSKEMADSFWTRSGIMQTAEELIEEALYENRHNSLTNILKRLIR